MPDEQRLLELEHELIETRRAAVSIVVGIAGTRSPQDRRAIADRLDRETRDADAVHARLSRLIAAALRLG